MKKCMTLMVALCLMASMSAFAQDAKKADAPKAEAAKNMEKAKEVTVTGIITDPMCAKSGKKEKMTDADCAKRCAKDGKLALVNDKDGSVWAIENNDAVKGHEGHHVKVVGHANAEKMTFHVASLTMDTSNMGKGEMKHDMKHDAKHEEKKK